MRRDARKNGRRLLAAALRASSRLIPILVQPGQQCKRPTAGRRKCRPCRRIGRPDSAAVGASSFMRGVIWPHSSVGSNFVANVRRK